MNTTTKAERINLRLDHLSKRKLEKAAFIEGKAVSQYILSNVLKSAEKTINSHEQMVLNKKDAELFFDAIINPPKPNHKLLDAMAEYDTRVAAK